MEISTEQWKQSLKTFFDPTSGARQEAEKMVRDVMNQNENQFVLLNCKILTNSQIDLSIRKSAVLFLLRVFKIVPKTYEIRKIRTGFFSKIDSNEIVQVLTHIINDPQPDIARLSAITLAFVFHLLKIDNSLCVQFYGLMAKQFNDNTILSSSKTPYLHFFAQLLSFKNDYCDGNSKLFEKLAQIMCQIIASPRANQNWNPEQRLLAAKALVGLVEYYPSIFDDPVSINSLIGSLKESFPIDSMPLFEELHKIMFTVCTVFYERLPAFFDTIIEYNKLTFSLRNQFQKSAFIFWADFIKFELKNVSPEQPIFHKSVEFWEQYDRHPCASPGLIPSLFPDIFNNLFSLNSTNHQIPTENEDLPIFWAKSLLTKCYRANPEEVFNFALKVCMEHSVVPDWVHHYASVTVFDAIMVKPYHFDMIKPIIEVMIPFLSTWVRDIEHPRLAVDAFSAIDDLFLAYPELICDSELETVAVPDIIALVEPGLPLPILIRGIEMLYNIIEIAGGALSADFLYNNFMTFKAKMDEIIARPDFSTVMDGKLMDKVYDTLSALLYYSPMSADDMARDVYVSTVALLERSMGNTVSVTLMYPIQSAYIGLISTVFKKDWERSRLQDALQSFDDTGEAIAPPLLRELDDRVLTLLYRFISEKRMAAPIAAQAISELIHADYQRIPTESIDIFATYAITALHSSEPEAIKGGAQILTALLDRGVESAIQNIKVIYQNLQSALHENALLPLSLHPLLILFSALIKGIAKLDIRFSLESEIVAAITHFIGLCDKCEHEDYTTYVEALAVLMKAYVQVYVVPDDVNEVNRINLFVNGFLFKIVANTDNWPSDMALTTVLKTLSEFSKKVSRANNTKLICRKIQTFVHKCKEMDSDIVRRTAEGAYNDLLQC